MINTESTVDRKTFKNLSRLYIIALSTIALSVIISQFLIRKHLNDQQSDSRVVNVAGRQRMLSQKLSKEILQISLDEDIQSRAYQKNNLRETLTLWETAHKALQNGSTALGIPNKNSDKVKELFTEINPLFDQVFESATIIANSLTDENSNDSKLINEARINVLAHEQQFLKLMIQIVNQYEIEAGAKVDKLRNLELLLTLLTMLLLLGELVFIFWPTAQAVRNTLTELIKSENKAMKMAHDADVLSVSKEKSIKELRALNQAMDETLLFARINSSGLIEHCGKKFSRFFKYTGFSSNASFAQVISANESEQVIIDNTISQHRKTGWQGEVKATNKDNDQVWLDMTIIPFNPSGTKSELLVIAFDITKRKEAQLEINRLNKESFDERIVQHKLISSKIIENQENEQNRIAKDVHDGIGQMLTGLKYNLESIDPTDVDKTTTKIELLKQQASNIIKGIRTATFNLTPPELNDHGIVPAITKLTHELSKLTGKNIILYNKLDTEQRLDSLLEINIYRITQEAINNAIKYADSSHIIVTLSGTDDLISIVIDDNGKGFDPAKIKTTKNGDGGMGLTFMKERMNYINGRFFINSEVGKGTKVTLNIPIEEEKVLVN